MKIKLTPKQNAVIYLLQNGWELITDSEMRGAEVCNSTHQFHINGGLFWNLVEKGLIFQNRMKGDWYTLTELGKEIKTKPVTI